MESQKFIINGGEKLRGEITVQGAKNSSLPILASVILCDGNVTLENCPRLSDVYCACRILNELGVSCEFSDNTVRIKNTYECKSFIPDEMMRKMRSSIVFLGSVLGRRHQCTLSLPGGCELGPRPVDMHMDALQKMGVTITEDGDRLICNAESGLKGAAINLKFPSVGATENIMLAAVLANGETIIRNAAREPEISDLAAFLNACGAKIKGAGKGTIVINGVKKLTGCTYKIMPDRIAAVTYMAAAASTGGELLLHDVRTPDIYSVTDVFERMGCHIYSYDEKIYINASGGIKGVGLIKTMPYPGFPTDAQAVIMSALSKSDGISIFEENIFENRFKHVDSLIRMGADINVVGKAAVINGIKKMHGIKADAMDLRGGAAIVVAALGADGESQIGQLRHIDRGYETMENILTSVGAKIFRK